MSLPTSKTSIKKSGQGEHREPGSRKISVRKFMRDRIQPSRYPPFANFCNHLRKLIEGSKSKASLLRPVLLFMENLSKSATDKLIWVLLKFGTKKHLEQLQQGTVYMNPLSYYHHCEQGNPTGRQDRYEGTSIWCNPNKTKIEINGSQLTAQGGCLSASLSFPDQISKQKVFCASCICLGDKVEDMKIVDDRLKQFGDHLLVIGNMKFFGERLKNALDNELSQHKITRFATSVVSYFDKNTYDGEVGVFRKRSAFSYQKEWRLMVEENTPERPYILRIPPITDISHLIETEKFLNYVEPRPDGTGHILKFS